MRVDFYQLGNLSAEAALPQLARQTLKIGERMLVVSADEAQLARIGAVLWEAKDSFLANGMAGGDHDARQPILLAPSAEPANGARFVALADGEWRDEALVFERAFLLFSAATLDGARGAWRALGDKDGVERRFWKRDGARWVEGP